MNSTTAHEIIEQSKKYTFFSWSVQSKINPILIDKASGVYFWDGEGKKYLDFSSQLMNTNIGHQHPRVVQAIKDQAEKICFVHPSNTTEIRAKLGKRISEISPGNLNKTFFTLGGSEANENAIKFVRFFTGKQKILSRYRSYHGATHGSIALSGDFRRLAAEPAIPGVVHFLDPYCYRCPFSQEKNSCNRECVKHLEQIIQYEGADKIAAIIMEGVVGSNGLIIPPDDYWPSVRKICSNNNILLISDEVMSGWGRTGEWFAVDNWKVVPDIITTAKGLTGGYTPLGAVIVNDEIAHFFDDKFLYAGLTYNAHALSCAAAFAAIDVYVQDRLITNSRELGFTLGKELEELKCKHKIIGDVRYIGLFSAIELVEDRISKKVINEKVMAEIDSFLKDQGLFTYTMANPLGSMIFIVPPLCITKEQLYEGLGIIDKVLTKVDEKQLDAS